MEPTLALVKQLMEEERGKKKKVTPTFGQKTSVPKSKEEGGYSVDAQIPPKVRHLNPASAARDRAMRRNLSAVGMEDLNEEAPEAKYDNNNSFFLDGIEIVPFNWEKDKEEGYLDSKGDFVYYSFSDDKEKDPRFESLQVDDYISASRYARKSCRMGEEILGEEETTEITQSIGKLYSGIGKALKGGETVSQALKRLKGNSGKRAKMRDEDQRAFDQLTGYATELVGWCYGVYDQKKEEFEEAAKRYAELQSDYGFDPSSGNYYNKSSGCYYDPASGKHSFACTGQWYSYNKQTGDYT